MDLKFVVPEGGIHQISMLIHFKKGEILYLSKAVHTRKTIFKPRFWEFWKKEVVREEIIPVECETEDISDLVIYRPGV